MQDSHTSKTVKAHLRQPRPSHGLDLRVKVLKTFEVVPSLLGSGLPFRVLIFQGLWVRRGRITSLLRNRPTLGPYSRLTHTQSPMVVLGGGAFSYERGHPVNP